MRAAMQASWIAVMVALALGCSSGEDAERVITGDAVSAASTTVSPSTTDSAGEMDPGASTTTDSPPVTNIGQSDTWRGQHDQFLADRQAVIDSFGSMYNPATMSNPPDVYLSDPVDINGPGNYPIRFAMPPGTMLRGWSIRQPPDFTANVLIEPVSLTANADGYLEANLRIDPTPGRRSNLVYPGLTVWLT